MKTATKYLIAILLMLTGTGAHAATQVVGYVTITNTPAGLSSNIVINIGSADTRYWTNSTAGAPSTSIQTTNSTAASATNLVAQLSAYPVYSAGAGTPQLLATINSTNTSVVNLYAPDNTNLTVTFGGLWARVVYVTNTFSDGVPILNRTNSMSSTARTNGENAIVNLLAANRATNALPVNTAFLVRYLDTNTAQTAAGKTFIGPVLSGGRITTVTNLTGTNVALTNVTLRLVTASGATITEGTYSGTISSLTNGSIFSNFLSYARLSNPVATNLVNYGNAIRSEGSGGNSLQIGSNAVSAGALSLAIGNGAVASNTTTLAIGTEAIATNNYAMAVGNGAIASGVDSFAVGRGSVAVGTGAMALGQGAQSLGGGAVSILSETTGDSSVSIGAGSSILGTNATAIGPSSSVSYNYSSAFGWSATATTTNQIRLGTATETVSIPGLITQPTSTNSVWKGTNTFNGRLDLTPRSNASMANGYNSGVVLGTNVYVRLSGHSAAATNSGFAASAAVDGTFHLVQVDNPGLSFTILNESGIDATAANRVLTGTGALKNSTNNPVLFKVVYDGNVSRWRLMDWPPN